MSSSKKKKVKGNVTSLFDLLTLLCLKAIRGRGTWQFNAKYLGINDDFRRNLRGPVCQSYLTMKTLYWSKEEN